LKTFQERTNKKKSELIKQERTSFFFFEFFEKGFRGRVRGEELEEGVRGEVRREGREGRREGS